MAGASCSSREKNLGPKVTNVIKARFHSASAASQCAYALGQEHSPGPYPQLAQANAMGVVQAESSTQRDAGRRDCRSRPGRLFPNEPCLSCAAQADGAIFSREQRVQ